MHSLESIIGGLCPPYLAGDVRGGVAGFYGSRQPGAVVTAAVGWVEQSETHHPAAGVVMGFGYRLYPSYAGYKALSRLGLGKIVVNRYQPHVFRLGVSVIPLGAIPSQFPQRLTCQKRARADLCSRVRLA